MSAKENGMNFRERLRVQWFQLRGLRVYGGALFRDGEILALVFNTDDLNVYYVDFADQKPVPPDTSSMSPEKQALTMLKFLEHRDEWVAFYEYVVSFAEELKSRLKLELIVASADNGIDRLIKECGIQMVLDACVPWLLESERVAAPPSNAAAPASKPIVLKVPEFSAAPQPPFHPDSSVHLEQLPAARRGVEEEVGDLLDGTDAIADHEISEVKPNVPNKKV
jgi:hypothetical protein